MRLSSTLAVLASLILPLPAVAADTIHVVAAENVYGDLARQIGGTHVSVTSVLSNPDADPHLFETNASTARAIAEAQIVIVNGIGYDPWMDKLLAAARGPSRTVVTVATLLNSRDGANPHLWYDPRALPAVAKALEADLEKRDPANAAAYRANLAAFDTAFTAVTAKIAAAKARHGGTKVTASEPVFGYMAEALGLTMLNEAFQTAVMNNTEPAASQVAAFEASLRTGEAKLLIYNSQVTDKTTERLRDLAKQAGVPVVGVTETEPAGTTAQDWLAGEIDAVDRALSKAKP